ncbi:MULTISPECIES: branched-chain amino acid ABC transporter permease [Bradyrhizobium]|uniref:branched-chain amino acid ABC transporter permease n=1 Tax=Bradyrhizobium TaxID=374 RepID=UPI002305CD0F|nr:MULTISPECIES: branched-chain amino acid ABC transporter permease [unclassified Bradyrhizobium]
MQRTSDQASDTKRWGAGALVFAALAVVGGMSNAYVISLLTIVLLFTFMGQSWNLMLGIGGQLSIGHALFVGIGAYAVAILNIKYGVTPWIGLLLGAVIAGFVGAVLAWLSFRFEVRGIYFALLTIAAAEFARIMFGGWDYVGGMQGLFYQAPSGTMDLGMLRGDARFYYFVALALAAIGVAGTELISRSYWGYVWRAMRDDEEAARALGVRTFRHKVLVVSISAATAAVGGGVLGLVQGAIFPDSIMGMAISVDVLIGPVVGGLGTAFGPLVGSMAAIPLHHAMGALGDSLGLPGLNSVAYGAVLILVVWFLPDGIWPAVVRLYEAIQLPARGRISQLRKVEE